MAWEMTGAAYMQELENKDDYEESKGAPSPADVSLENLTRTVDFWRHHEIRPMTRACYEWLGDFALPDPQFAEAVHDMFERRPNLNPKYGLEVIVRAINDIESRWDPSYPAGREHVSTWVRKKTLQHLKHPDSRDDFERRLDDEIITNYAKRGMAVKIVALTHGLESMSLFEFGCGSGNQIGKKLAEHMEPGRGYSDSHIINRVGRTRFGGRTILTPHVDKYLSHNFNQAVQNEPFELDVAVGFDILDPASETGLMERSVHNLYIDEQADEQKVAEHIRLSEMEHPRVRRVSGIDLAQPLNDQTIEAHASGPVPEKADMVLMSYFAYQMKNAQKLTVAIENAVNKTKRFVGLLDAVRFLPGHMVFVDNREPFSGAFYLWDMESGLPPETGFKKMFEVENGRLNRLRPLPDLMNTPNIAALLGPAAARSMVWTY